MAKLDAGISPSGEEVDPNTFFLPLRQKENGAAPIPLHPLENSCDSFRLSPNSFLSESWLKNLFGNPTRFINRQLIQKNIPRTTVSRFLGDAPTKAGYAYQPTIYPNLYNSECLGPNLSWSNPFVSNRHGRRTSRIPPPGYDMDSGRIVKKIIREGGPPDP